MLARNSEDLDRLFAAALHSGNLDTLVALYEPQAALTPEPGHVLTGAQAIRAALRAGDSR
jgi:ketosteroid isomerase-like protein